MSTLMKFLQIHSVVHAGDLIAVAVEDHRGPREYFAKAAPLVLAPTGMVDIGIDVGVEAVFLRRVAVPGSRRFFFLEADFYPGFDALIAVLPGDDHATRRTVLRRKSLAVHADAKEGKRVHGFVETKAFDIGKIDAAIFCLGHLARVVEGFKGDIAGLWRGLDQLGEHAEGEPDPGHNDGPALHATMAVNTLFKRGQLQDFVHREFARFGDFALNGDSPGRSLEILGILGGIAFIGAEFVEVVVVGYVVERTFLFGGAKGALYEAGELGSRKHEL